MRHKVTILVLISLFMMGMVGVGAFAAEKGLSGADKDFFKKAASAGMMEVELGQLAQSKGQSQEVKDFGSRMTTDHGKANDELRALAQQKNFTLPTKMERKHHSMVQKLTKASGADFDKKYMTAMVKDHKNDVAEFKKAAKKVNDPDLKAWAEKTLPVLEQHLQQAESIAPKVGATAK